jgi:antitoxin MazE
MYMLTTVQRWGNSLAVRIPKPFALQAALEENSEVDISVEEGRIVVSRATKEWKLKELLAGITRRNSHKEIKWGDRAGGEAW